MRDSKISVISLGWGVQSWTLAAMIALGDAPPVDYVIHSDTTWEKDRTYKFADEWGPWLESKGISLITVTDSKTKQITDKWGGVFIPAFTVGPKGKRGQLRRQCTSRWKIEPIRRFIRTAMRQHKLKVLPGTITMQLGITLDEYTRAKDSSSKYIINEYPFLDLKWDREDCLDYLDSNGLPSPGKSACTFCPYHSMEAWNQLNGVDLKEAIMVDEAIRDKRGDYPLYVHPKRVPLREIERTVEEEGLECDSGYCFL